MADYTVDVYINRRIEDVEALLGAWLQPGRDFVRFDGLYHASATEAVIGVLRKLRALGVPYVAIRTHYCRPAGYAGWRDEVAR